MFKLSESVLIDRPIDEVFVFVSDPATRHIWQPGLHEVRIEGDKHTEVRKLMGRRVEHVLERVAHVKNSHVTYKAVGRGHDTTLTTHITFDDEGQSTRVTVELELDTRGMLASGEPTIKRIIQREVSSNLEHLKDILEAHPDVRTVIHETFPKHEGASHQSH